MLLTSNTEIPFMCTETATLSVYMRSLCIKLRLFLFSPSFSRSDDDGADLSAVTPLLVAFYMLCYTPFFVSEVTTLHHLHT